MELKDFGLLEGIRDARDYIFGDGNCPFIPYQPDGNWEPFLPRYEPQSENFETYCCTVWGTQNALETLHKRLYGIEPNYSERFTSLLSGLDGTKGTDPQYACESIRKDGVIDNTLLPMTDTKEEFFDMDGITGSLRAKGIYWRERHDFKHEWLWDGQPSNYIEVMKKALTTSPLGVSVSAWTQDGYGKYVSNGRPNNHWCMVYRIDDEGIHVFDSYDHSKKILTLDHDIRMAKRYFLQTKTRSAMQKDVWSLTRALNFLLSLVKKK